MLADQGEVVLRRRVLRHVGDEIVALNPNHSASRWAVSLARTEVQASIWVYGIS